MKKYYTSVNTIQEHTTATILLYATPFSQFINSPSRTDLYLLVLEKIFCERLFCTEEPAWPPANLDLYTANSTNSGPHAILHHCNTERKETYRLDRFSGRL